MTKRRLPQNARHAIHTTRKHRRCGHRAGKQYLFLFGVLSILVVTCVFTFAITSNAKQEHALHKYYTSIQIEDGDSLWSIAQEYSNVEMYADYDAYISEVKQLNHMTGEDIHSGQYLIVPYYTADLK